jgi:hypothetical protein
MPEVDSDVSSAPKIGTAAETMSPWNAGWNTHWSRYAAFSCGYSTTYTERLSFSLGLGLSRPNSPAEAHLDPGLDGGEATEWAWAELKYVTLVSAVLPQLTDDNKQTTWGIGGNGTRLPPVHR